jgi:ubiquinone/menaquinone biosynthesis C-methylase UbiE
MRGIEQIPWIYDALCHLCERGGLGRWRQWLVRGARGRTLDLGCGTGRNLPLLPAGTRPIALDPSAEALTRARRRAPHITFVQARAEALPFRDNAFDTVLSGLVFCSVGDPGRGLAEVRRVLAPDGELRMLEHVRSTTRWRACLQDALQPAWTWIAGGCHPNRDTEDAVTRAGFVIDERRAQDSMRRFRARASPPAAC